LGEDKAFGQVEKQARGVVSLDLRRLERSDGRFVETMLDQDT
jgi:hypothetical protein